MVMPAARREAVAHLGLRMRSASGGRVQRLKPIARRFAIAAVALMMPRYGRGFANSPPFAVASAIDGRMSC